MSVIDRTYDNIRLTRYVREVPQRGGAILDRFLPNRDRQTRTFKVRTLQQTDGEAQFRGFDTPSPVVGRPGYTEQTGTLPPISESMVIGEDETLGIYERVVAGAWDEEIDDVIYDDARRITNRILNRVERARAGVLVNGRFEMTFARDGLIATADFGRDVGNAMNAAATWATASNSILTDVRTMQEKSLDERGQALAYLLVSSTTVSRMVLNNEIRAMLGAGTGNTPTIVTPQAVGQLFASLNLPALVQYDYKVSGSRLIDADLVIGLPELGEELGETQWGVTAESLVLPEMTRDVRPGLVATVRTQDNPVQKLTDVTGLVMPVLGDPNLIYTMDTTPA